MRHMVWYKGLMKIPKKVYLVAAVLLFMGGAGTVLALQPNTPAKEVTIKQVAASTPVQTAPVTQPTQTAVAPTPAPAVAPVTPTPPAPTVTNPFQQGFSAWYVFNRRVEVGKAMPTSTSINRFCVNFTSDPGFQASTTPSLYAVSCRSGSGGRDDHAAFVEALNADGSIWVSEMNSRGQVSMTDSTKAGGFYSTDYRLLPADEVAAYKFMQ